MAVHLLRGELGFNTFFIRNNFEGMNIITREDDLPPLGENDTVIRWGTTRRIPNGPKIINKVKAIQETSEKGTFRKKVGDAGHAPKTWLSVEEWALYALEHGVQPVIVRPLVHQRSEGLILANNLAEVRSAVAEFAGGYYISEYIAKEKEYRVFIAQGRPFIVVEKMPQDRNAVSWGCVEQGSFEYIAWEDWPQSVVECAVNSFNLSGLDFAAIDIISKDDQAYFLEANTAPEILGYYGASFAKVFKHMLANGRERIPVTSFANWKNIIHPGMSVKAVV